MTDREKVLEGLESCAKSDPENWCYHMCEHCPYDLTAGCKHILAADALELLKEQKAEIERLKKPDCEHAAHDGAGCLGYSGCWQDDEPIDACKKCVEYTGNIILGDEMDDEQPKEGEAGCG